MKHILIIGFILFSSQASSNNYFGCGLGVNHIGIVAADWLEHSADDLAMAQCWLDSSPAIQADGFFNALPSLRWQAAKPSTFSRTLSQEKSKQQSFDLQWSFFRNDALMVGISAGIGDLQQQQQINQDLQWLAHNNLIIEGQPVIIKQQEKFVGVFIDAHYTDVFFDQISIKRHYYQLPLKISYMDPNAAPNSIANAFLSDIKTENWQIELRKNPHGHGLLSYWAFNLGSGEITSSVHPAASTLDSPYFITAEFMLGLQWRYRVSSNLHPFIDINGRSSYWYFSENSNQTYTVDKAKRVSYQASTGVSWKF